MKRIYFSLRQMSYNIFLILVSLASLLYVIHTVTFSAGDSSRNSCPYEWHGGSPTQSHVGSCWCGSDSYCMCTPSLAIDCIIEYRKSADALAMGIPSHNDVEIVLVWRQMAPKDIFAIPGGFVGVGETVEEATIREGKYKNDCLHLEGK